MKNLLRNKKVKLSGLLTTLVSISVLLTIIILLISVHQSEREFMEETHLSLNYSKVKKISQTVDNLFVSMSMSLQEITNYIASHEGLTDDEIQEQLEIYRNSGRYFNSVAWVDQTGLVRNIAPSSVGLRGHRITTGVTKEILDNKTPALSDPYIAPTGRLILLISKPLYNSRGQYKGMIAGTIYLHEKNVLNEILGNDVIEENGSYYYVVGPEGNILFHPISKRIGENVKSNTVVEKIMQGKSGMEQVTNTNGIPMLAAYSYVPEIGWGVVQQTPVSFIDKVILSHHVKMILYMLAPFLIILMISILIARKLAAPFKNLAEIVNRVAEGKSVTIPDDQTHWNWEAEMLTKSARIAIKAVQENNERLMATATTDALTNIPNRSKLNTIMENLADINQVFSIVVIDIDRFKDVNDTYGHQKGDEVLKFLANMLKTASRKEDFYFRYGGEEFVLLLPQTKSKEAFLVAEKIRLKVEKTDSPVGSPITISLGIAEFPKNSGKLEELFSKADKALYESKLNGRNRTTIWNDKKSHSKNNKVE
ncbi:sensor domain-containing diguanylate cyclase [Lottiidibacillus patelloidae]|nr:sensor domain-containing diguanylate cyclase [Lottiidibacillus patelloidae]